MAILALDKVRIALPLEISWTFLQAEQHILKDKRSGLMVPIDFCSGVQNATLVEITVTGRTSGRPISLPIWFVLEDNTLYLIPVKGSDTEWYKNVRKTPTIQVSAHGKTVTASTHVLTNQAHLDHVLELFREKYGRNVKSYYPKYDVAVEVKLP
jgi:deazaflavin-dependent oxidoreductase (nitroreductase family)